MVTIIEKSVVEALVESKSYSFIKNFGILSTVDFSDNVFGKRLSRHTLGYTTTHTLTDKDSFLPSFIFNQIFLEGLFQHTLGYTTTHTLGAWNNPLSFFK